MSSPTVINEEYDIVIAGGEPTTFSPTFFLLTAFTSDYDRRHGSVRRCQSSGCCRYQLACPLTRGRSHDVQ